MEKNEVQKLKNFLSEKNVGDENYLKKLNYDSKFTLFLILTSDNILKCVSFEVFLLVN